jgi:hypothetical protein
MRRYGAELALSVAFIGALLLTNKIPGADTSLALGLLAVLAPALVLTLWFGFYVVTLRSMDELEQAMETRSLAIACGVTLWITTVWGVAGLALGVSVLPLVFVAPLAAAIFGIVRVIVGLRYR